MATTIRHCSQLVTHLGTYTLTLEPKAQSDDDETVIVGQADQVGLPSIKLQLGPGEECRGTYTIGSPDSDGNNSSVVTGQFTCQDNNGDGVIVKPGGFAAKIEWVCKKV